MASKSTVMRAGILIFIAIVLFAIGGGLIIHDKIGYKGFVKIKATIIGYDEKLDYDVEDDSYDILYAEIVQYIVDGMIYKATNPLYSSKLKLEKGEQIEIAYNPKYPSQCIFVKSRKVFPIILMAFGSVFLLIGIIIAILGRSIGKSNSKTKDYSMSYFNISD